MSKQTVESFAPAFKALGDPVRLRLMSMVDAERRATWVYYRPRPALLRRLAARLSIGSRVA